MFEKWLPICHGYHVTYKISRDTKLHLVSPMSFPVSIDIF